MSRVFEALEKASKESKEVVAKAGKGLLLVDEPAKTPGVGGNGKDRLFVVPSRSWRERAEELLFGWDLKKYKNYPLVALEKDSKAAEQYKMLREQIRRLRAEGRAQFLSVTSPVKRDGKSTVAANLAASFALEYQERVLVIDCDLRNPQMHQYFGAQPNPGLTDYLTSSSSGDILKYVQDTFLPGLQVLPAGKPSGLSSELLATEKMKNLMEDLRRRLPNHQVIVDCPPVLSTPDPLIMARQVDGIIVVIRAGKTPRDCLLETLETLKSDKIIGIVLNGAELGFDSKYYDY
jgi:protein-tyrosine kinase